LLDGRLSLTTPEGVRLLLTPAGPFLRAGAWAIDFALWAGLMAGLQGLTPAGKFGQGILLILMFVTFWGYPILCEV
jgi:hypothetical protein